MHPDEQELRETLKHARENELTANFRASDFFRKDLNQTNETLADIIQFYEVDRGCEEYESIFDIKNDTDFGYLAKKYGFATTKELIEGQVRYFFDGLNFKQPVPIVGGLITTINALLDEDFFTNIIENGYEDGIGDWFDLPSIKRYLIERGFIQGEVRYYSDGKVEAITKNEGGKVAENENNAPVSKGEVKEEAKDIYLVSLEKWNNGRLDLSRFYFTKQEEAEKFFDETIIEVEEKLREEGGYEREWCNGWKIIFICGLCSGVSVYMERVRFGPAFGKGQ